MATARDSVLYDAAYVKHYLVGAGSPAGEGRPIIIPFELTVVSVSAISDTYNLCVIRGGYRVVNARVWVTTGLGASAAAGRTLSIGDAGSATRFINALDADLTGALGELAYTGAGYTPTADLIVLATIGGGAAVVGGKAVGFFECVAGA